MQAFHNDPAIKQKYLDRVRKHREMDNLIQGTGWENGKGCAVGCTLENYDHFRYPIELGIPTWLAMVEDKIFEGLPQNKAMDWPERFLSAIRVGDNLERVKAPFLIFVLESALEAFDHDEFPKVKAVLDDLIRLFESGETDLLNFEEAAWAARKAAEAAGAAARRAAGAAAEAAGAAAVAAEAAGAAAAGAATAWAAAAWAAAAWAAVAAGSKKSAYIKFSDKLIELFEGERE